MHFTAVHLLVLFCVLLGIGALLWITLAMLMAWAMLCPPRMSAGKAIYHLRRLSPGDLRLNFEEQIFLIRDLKSGAKRNIASWWIPSAVRSDTCVTLIHGYADAKVGAIAWAPLFFDLNINVLAIDLRAHGDSGGRFSTGGYHERDDVNQVIDQLSSLYPGQTRQLMLFGASLGGAVAAAVAAQRQDISGIILDSPFTDFERAIAAHTRAIGLPGGLLLRAAIGLAQWFSAARFREVRPVDTLAKIKCPALIIVGSDDALLETEDFRQLEQAAALNSESRYWLADGAGHLQAMAVDPIEYEKRIGDFISMLRHAWESQKSHP